MKRFLTVLAAGAALVAAPLSAQAYSGHGGGGRGGGGFHSAGGFHGGFGGFRGGPGYRGGYRGYGYGYAGLGLGVGLLAGAALADPWYDGYYGYAPGYPVAYADPAYAYAPPPPGPPQAAAPQACGQWIWDQSHGSYAWAPGAC